MEKIPIKPRNPAHYSMLPFNISIPTSKEESICNTQLAEEEIKVYMDGSGTNGKVEAAATLMRQGKPNRTLHYHLGSEKEHTVHEAELIGILLAI